MVAIWLRAEAKVPVKSQFSSFSILSEFPFQVILMGSTGCGKTALVKYSLTTLESLSEHLLTCFLLDSYVSIC